jgi:hypothetical protein
VSKKPVLDKEQKYLLDEKELLSTKFKELNQKYQVLLDKLENQLNDFLNGKNAGKNKINADFLTFREETRKGADKLIIEKENLKRKYQPKIRERKES